MSTPCCYIFFLARVALAAHNFNLLPTVLLPFSYPLPGGRADSWVNTALSLTSLIRNMAGTPSPPRCFPVNRSNACWKPSIHCCSLKTKFIGGRLQSTHLVNEGDGKEGGSDFPLCSLGASSAPSRYREMIWKCGSLFPEQGDVPSRDLLSVSLERIC